MIDIIKQTPPEYSRQSRDYQILARMFTALYNFNKMYADNMSVWGSDIDNKLTLLRAKTLNFSPKHAWDSDDLEAAVSCFKTVMFLKGTKKAIEFCIYILMRINNLSGYTNVSIDNNVITIKIPEALANVGVVEDLMSYIIPVGATYRIIEYKLSSSSFESESYISDTVTTVSIGSNKLGIYKTSTTDSDNQGYSVYHDNVNDKTEVVNND